MTIEEAPPSWLALRVGGLSVLQWILASAIAVVIGAVVYRVKMLGADRLESVRARRRR